MYEEGLFAVGDFDIGFRNTGLKIEDGIAGEGVSLLPMRTERCTYASSLKALSIRSISAS